MGLLNRLWGRRAPPEEQPEIICADLYEAAQDYAFRKLAIDTCINMTANAIGNCEFKTYFGGKENKNAEYFLWNISPNKNENSSEFIHKMIAKLLTENEVLIISTGEKAEELFIADSFQKSLDRGIEENFYTDIYINGVSFGSRKESQVIYLKQNNSNINRVLQMAAASYERMMNLSEAAYSWSNGKHVKVKVSQTEQLTKNFNENFAEKIQDQLKPFINSVNSVLPEFEGYDYTMFNDTAGSKDTRDIRALADDIFTFTARAYDIPAVLLMGDVANSEDAMNRWLTVKIDPLCSQIQEEINRKRYSQQLFINGSYVHIDTTNIIHFDMFKNAANVEKLIGSGCFSVNDILKAAGQSEINDDWANKHWLTKNIGSFEDAAKSFEKGGNEGEKKSL